MIIIQTQHRMASVGHVDDEVHKEGLNDDDDDDTASESSAAEIAAPAELLAEWEKVVSAERGKWKG